MRAARFAACLSALLLAGRAGAVDDPKDKLTEVLITCSKRFMPMDPIVTPIFGESDIEGTISVQIVIETADPTVSKALDGQKARLRSAALTTTLEFARLQASGYAPVDAAALKQALNRALIAADPRVRRVLIVRLGASDA